MNDKPVESLLLTRIIMMISSFYFIFWRMKIKKFLWLFFLRVNILLKHLWSDNNAFFILNNQIFAYFFNNNKKGFSVFIMPLWIFSRVSLNCFKAKFFFFAHSKFILPKKKNFFIEKVYFWLFTLNCIINTEQHGMMLSNTSFVNKVWHKERLNNEVEV